MLFGRMPLSSIHWIFSLQCRLVTGQRPPHNILHVVGQSKLAKGLVNRQVIAYTLLEKRESGEDRASYQGLV